MPFTGRRNFNKAPSSNPVQGTLMLLSILVLVLVVGFHLVAGIQFKRKYAGHLKRAADANSLTLAERELAVAVAYLDGNGFNTEGGRSLGRIDDHTSILYSSPSEQISYHYDNVTASLAEIRSVIAKGEKATPLERSNVLMKLRETLLDDGESGQRVTFPQGLDVYPNNTLLVFLMVMSLVVMVGSYLTCNRR
jgi:hypothetical protein